MVATGWSLLAARLAQADRFLPRHVTSEVEAFLRCGDPQHGFAWLTCEPCGHHRLIPFSCKKRGFCSSCAGRRMAETAAAWVDRVIPRVRTRQWVLTMPYRRRVLLARRPALERGVHRVAMECMERWYSRQANGGQTGSVTVTQRFGSALQLNLHFHSIFLDGCYARDLHGLPRFRPVTPHTSDVEKLVVEVAAACEAWLSKEGHGLDDEDLDPDDDGLGVFHAAAAAGYSAVRNSPTRVARRVQVVGGKERKLPPMCASCDGYNLHAGVAIGAEDRTGLEQLGRYLLRPPLAKGRLELQGDGSVVFEMKRAYADGTSALRFTPEELVERLVALVPPPRANQVVYRGVLAAHAAMRREVVPKGDEPDRPPAPPTGIELGPLSKKPKASIGHTQMTWAQILWRVFEVSGWHCSVCGEKMHLRHVMEGGPTTKSVLAGLMKAAAPP